MDFDQLSDWIAFNLILVLAAVIAHSTVRRVLWRRLEPHVPALLIRVGLRPATEPVPGVLWTAMYRQRLCGHLERVRRLVATDEGRSATRQIANRMALARLLHDLAELPVDLPALDELAARPDPDAPIETWSPFASPVRDRSWPHAPAAPGLGTVRSAYVPGAEARGRSTVEVLELGWGR